MGENRRATRQIQQAAARAKAKARKERRGMTMRFVYPQAVKMKGFDQKNPEKMMQKRIMFIDRRQIETDEPMDDMTLLAWFLDYCLDDPKFGTGIKAGIAAEAILSQLEAGEAARERGELYIVELDGEAHDRFKQVLEQPTKPFDSRMLLRVSNTLLSPVQHARNDADWAKHLKDNPESPEAKFMKRRAEAERLAAEAEKAQPPPQN